jgi:hypothetical protein
MTYTGGQLNELNGKMGISAPHKSVPVMKLIKIHKPKSKEELVLLIKYHFENECSCGIKSQGTLKDFGNNLYNSQLKYWKENRFTHKECLQWEYDLFIVQSLKGGILEQKAITLLKKLLPQYIIKEAKGYLDEEVRVDIIISKNNRTICGIQVKPKSFKYARKNVIDFNLKANKKYKKPVFYLYYNEEDSFIAVENLILEIQK